MRILGWQITIERARPDPQWVEDWMEGYYRENSIIRNVRTGENVWIAPSGPGSTARGVGSVTPQRILGSDEWVVLSTSPRVSGVSVIEQSDETHGV